MVFIDGSNLYKGIRKLGLSGYKLTTLNFLPFCESFIDKNTQRVVRIYYYDALLKADWDKSRYKSQQQFHSFLKKHPNLELKFGRLQGTYPNVSEKGIDSLISVDMIKFAYNNSYDIGILISADGDYVPAVQLCKDMGKNIWTVVPESLKCYHLQTNSDRYFSFNASRVEEFQVKP